MVPRAYGSHHGLPSPANAGTRYTPPLSGTVAANGPISAAEPIRPSPSRSHWMAAPVTNTAPSNAYATVPSASCHATVVNMPSEAGGQVGPTLSRTKLPVPYVFLAMPGVKHAWPISAACWSPATPEIGMPDSVTPNLPLDGITVGSADIGTPNSSHSAVDHCRVRMSNSIVRLAFVGSVACTVPPVRFQINQASMVPSASSLSTGISRLASNHSNFVAEKYGSSTRPVVSRTSGRWPAACNASHRSAGRRRVQTVRI